MSTRYRTPSDVLVEEPPELLAAVPDEPVVLVDGDAFDASADPVVAAAPDVTADVVSA